MNRTFVIIIMLSLVSSGLLAERMPGLIKFTLRNYANNQEVGLMKKLELGITLPLELREKVQRFIDNEEGEKINPFLEWELRIYAVFVNLESGDTIEVDGFYFSDYVVQGKTQLPKPKNLVGYSDDEYRNLASYRAVPDPEAMFLVRFSPPETGDWEVQVYADANHAKFYSNPQEFKVVESEYFPYLSVGENGRYFEQEGKSFMPIASNHVWPLTKKAWDEELWKNLHYRLPDGRLAPIPETYRPVYVLPRVHDKYRERMDLLIDSGINMLRTIMYPSSTEIEWEKLGDYSKRLPMASEMDKTLELAEERGVYLLWNLQIHYSFQFSKNAYGQRWAWDQVILGDSMCYRKLIGSDDPMGFFTNEEARKYYKQRLRYIISRYGYSSNIGLFELFSEISNVGAQMADNSGNYMEGDNWKIYTDWQVEMGEYIKSLYNGKNHLLTCSFAGPKSDKDNLYEHDCFDVMSSNIYNFNEPGHAGFWIGNMSKNFVNELPGNHNSYTMPQGDESRRTIKPVIFSESDPVIIEIICDTITPEFERFYWQSMFSGNAFYASWMMMDERVIPSFYNEAKLFFSDVKLDEDKWHPGASELITRDSIDGWGYNQDYAEDMFGDIRHGLFRKKTQRNADLLYLRSGDKNQAMGVLTNRTYNVYSAMDCFDEKWDANSNDSIPKGSRWQGKPLREKATIDLKKEKLIVQGLHKNEYVVSYFYPSDPNTVIYKQNVKGNKAHLEFPEFLADADHFILLFKLERAVYLEK